MPLTAEQYLAYKVTRKAKYIIYTAISENYDDLIQHAYICRDADYVCYTDKHIVDAGIWEIRALTANHLDHVRSAKYYKLFPDQLFPNDLYSLWIDGNIDVLNDRLELRLDRLINDAVVISANPHFERDCAYDEAAVCLFAKLDDSEIIRSEVRYLKQEGFPHNFGLFEMNIIFRQHHHGLNISVMNSWWDMILRFSRRDQISFTYALHKNKSSCERLFLRNSRLDKDFAFKRHNSKLASILYVDIGHGFNETDTVKSVCTIHDDHQFEAFFDLQNFETVEKLRFDPIEQHFCKLSIEHIKIVMVSPQSDQTRLLITLQSDCVTNGVLAENGFLEFETLDPFVAFKAFGNVKRVVIQGKILLLHTNTVANKIIQRTQDQEASHRALKIDHEATLSVLRHDIAAAEQTIEICKTNLTDSHAAIQILNNHIDNMHTSMTWKIGQKVLWLPRLLLKR